MLDLKMQLQNMFCKGDSSEDDIKAVLIMNHHSLPLFYQGHLVRKLWLCDLPENLKEKALNTQSRVVGYKIGEVFYLLNRNKTVVEMSISPEQCFGNTWIYQNNFDELKPDIDKIAKLLTAKNIRDIPTLQAYKADNHYICTDGNHRIYAAFLVGKKVMVDCFVSSLCGYYASGETVSLSE